MKFKAIVRHGAMGQVGDFFAEFGGLRMGDKCIIRTARGVEVGQVRSSIEPAPPSDGRSYDGEILRRMTPDDIAKYANIEEVDEPAEFEFCKKKIQERKLPMNLTSVEHLFGGTKVIFYFLSEGRVDFRDLVKDLAQEYRTRIEMRQIGVRDEARLLADYEHCGRELCCKTFIKNLEPVTMKMAKSQKATLDPSKISGRCGRLMCCLRFEDKVYEELKRTLPRKGTRVNTPEGEGVVTGQVILRESVKVELDKDQEEHVFKMSELQPVGGSCCGQQCKESCASGEGQGCQGKQDKQDKQDNSRRDRRRRGNSRADSNRDRGRSDNRKAGDSNKAGTDEQGKPNE
jgi:cell fate regulator YaaT (PSP1 superfamily)